MPLKKVAKPGLTPDQDKENIDPATLSRRMQQSRDRRKVEKRNQLQSTFDGAVAGMEGKIEELIKTSAEECATLRVDFTARLMELFKKRGEIEAQIIVHSRALEQAYSNADDDLKAVLKGKQKDIETGLAKAGNRGQEAESPQVMQREEKSQ